MNNQNMTLMELCETNCFSDSEEEDMSESDSDSDKEEDIIKKQPQDTKGDTKNDKITIIVDSICNEKTEEKYDDWENIEFTELEDIINDPSSNLFINKKIL